MTKTIMVVDDSASVRQVVNIILKNSGYDVIEARDGVEAMQKLYGRKVNLVICDVNMPNMDGITFVRTMKTSHTHKFTPVIMLTTESSTSRMDEGKQAGAKAWFMKPFKPETMLAAISKLVMFN